MLWSFPQDIVLPMVCRCIFSEFVPMILPLDDVARTGFAIPAGEKSLFQEHGISQLDFYSGSTLSFNALAVL